jgi:prepilin-type N-terminal cleavage/methylation domain-containing protein
LRRRPDAGFSLLEAVVALAIVGVAAVAGLGSLGAELRAAERAQRTLEASALAGHHLTRIRVLPPTALTPLPDSLREGRFPPPMNEYAWRAHVRPVRGEADLFDVAVEVVWEGGAFPLHARLYRPVRPYRPMDGWP